MAHSSYSISTMTRKYYLNRKIQGFPLKAALQRSRTYALLCTPPDEIKSLPPTTSSPHSLHCVYFQKLCHVDKARSINNSIQSRSSLGLNCAGPNKKYYPVRNYFTLLLRFSNEQEVPRVLLIVNNKDCLQLSTEQQFKKNNQTPNNTVFLYFTVCCSS